MRLLFVGNFDVTRGSGYATILSSICTELAGRGHQITVLGMNWDRSEHYYPFQVIPTDYGWIPVHVLRLHQALNFDHAILAVDVPKIVEMLDEVKRQGLTWPAASGLFPIESDPLVSIWANGLVSLRRRFVISRFGQRVLEDTGLDAIYVPMTACLPERRTPKPEARRTLKELVAWGDADLLDGERPTGLTVADNQERKDLPVIAAAFAEVEKTDRMRPVWLLVTRMQTPYGWYLPDVLERMGMDKRTVIFEGLPADQMPLVYSAADFFVLASQAEGACLPLYEAMAHDLPCIAPDHTAISEALADGRGTLIHSNGRSMALGHSIHPWGNVNRYHTQVDELAAAIVAVGHPGDSRLTDFIESRPWSMAADAIEEGLNG